MCVVVTLPNRKPFSTHVAYLFSFYHSPRRNPSESEAIFNIESDDLRFLNSWSRNPSESEAIFNYIGMLPDKYKDPS